jgi:glucokinase
MTKILAADFGGTRIKFGVVEDGIIKDIVIIPSFANESYDVWLVDFKAQVLKYCELYGVDFETIDSMVWAVPLVIHPSLKFASLHFGKFKDMTHKLFTEKVEAIFGKFLILENDARSALIGEATYGAGKNYKNIGMITLGTGVGTAVMMECLPLRGANGRAGNMDGVSQMYVRTDDPADAHSAGLEYHVATWSLPDRIKNHLLYKKSELRTKDTLDYRQVFESASNGDELATIMRDNAIKGWQALALNMINSYDLECIIFGGGIIKSANYFIPIIEKFIMSHSSFKFEICISELNENAALLGNYKLYLDSSSLTDSSK